MNALAQNVTKLSKDYEALKKKCRQQQAEIKALKADNDKLTEALLKANRVYDFDNPLLDKELEK